MRSQLTLYTFLLISLLLTACQPEPDVAIRLMNLTTLGVDYVRVTFPEETVDYGPLPRLGKTQYRLLTEVYAQASISADIEGKTYQLVATDPAGETPLEAGNYTYVLDFDHDGIQQALISDDAPHRDEALVGTHWLWTEVTLADGTVIQPKSSDPAEIPGILFTEFTSQNEALDGLLYGVYTGCNGGGGSFYTNDRQALIMQRVDLGREVCDDATMSAEAALLNVLNGISTYQVDGDTLQIISPVGDKLTFVR